MTSLAGLYEWLVAGKAASKAALRRREGLDYRLRAVPREEIHFYIKEIDNTRLVRLPDRRDTASSMGWACGVVLTAAMLVAVLTPGGYSLLASRRIERLKTERESLVNTLRELRVKEARMLSPVQMEQWAGDRFVEPSASAVVFAPPSEGTVASLNQAH